MKATLGYLIERTYRTCAELEKGMKGKTITLRSETHFSKLLTPTTAAEWKYAHTDLPAGAVVELVSVSDHGFNGCKGYVRSGEWTMHVDLDQLVTTV